mmetsp:Transcript_30399/g.50300  ORF Transcript_30399/g.50300 Transcript_30399/m.50300 type:complete len:218 (+) Transcript_30399:203-856(+)
MMEPVHQGNALAPNPSYLLVALCEAFRTIGRWPHAASSLRTPSIPAARALPGAVSTCGALGRRACRPRRACRRGRAGEPSLIQEVHRARAEQAGSTSRRARHPMVTVSTSLCRKAFRRSKSRRSGPASTGERAVHYGYTLPSLSHSSPRLQWSASYLPFQAAHRQVSERIEAASTHNQKRRAVLLHQRPLRDQRQSQCASQQCHSSRALCCARRAMP